MTVLTMINSNLLDPLNVVNYTQWNSRIIHDLEYIRKKVVMS